MIEFPQLQARSLLGSDKLLPRDLPARRTLVLLAFKQSQQATVDAWISLAEQAGWAPDLSAVDPGEVCEHAVIEVPCLGRRWTAGRRFIDGGMASGIGVPLILARTWTAYTDVGAVQRALGIADSERVWAGVVERPGSVLAAVYGQPSEPSWAVVSAALAG